ncbi:MAG: hypothetical protein ABFS19_12485 [Thermodesulfobacteriota bacterium]
MTTSKKAVLVCCLATVLIIGTGLGFDWFGFAKKQGVSSDSSRLFSQPAVSASPARPDGWLVYQTPQGIYKIHSSGKGGKLLAPKGRLPRWSPDGKKIGFIRGNDIVLMAGDGTRERLLTKGTGVRTLCFHPAGRSLLFSDKKGLHSIDLRGGAVKTIATGHEIWELDLAGKPVVMIATVKTLVGWRVKIIAPGHGKGQPVSMGCSASLSPDGRYATVNSRSHKELYFFEAKSKKKVHRIKSPRGIKFDNQLWSNHPQWLVSSVGKSKTNRRIYLNHAVSGTAFRLTSVHSDRGDFFVTPSRTK